VRERTAHWVRPELVAQIGFTEWTRDGMLRHPRFQGLRNDKPAAEVVRETR
jgi:ATP-dependent DNA ligase